MPVHDTQSMDYSYTINFCLRLIEGTGKDLLECSVHTTNTRQREMTTKNVESPIGFIVDLFNAHYSQD